MFKFIQATLLNLLILRWKLLTLVEYIYLFELILHKKKQKKYLKVLSLKSFDEIFFLIAWVFVYVPYYFTAQLKKYITNNNLQWPSIPSWWRLIW